MNLEERYEDACRALEYNKLEDAQIILEAILSEAPDYYPSINKLGVVYTRKKQLDAARSCFNKVLAINPDYAPSIVNLGNLFFEDGNDEAAIEYYKCSIGKDTAYHMAYYNLAVLYKKKGQYDEYMRYLREYKRFYKQFINGKQQHRGIRLKKKLGCLTDIILILTVIGCIIVVLMI
ncbi:MAG: hypothetical protein APF77_06375 [Clostridia bacterium BRH_c25]|nr:MAG: hypothetical protein APF77_06375 [Clostridia bacterium BRH_c25]